MKTKAFRKFFGTLAILALALGAGVVLRSVSAGTETGLGFLWGGGTEADGAAPWDGTNTAFGWVSMNDTNAGSGGGAYGVNIPASGDLSGYAWSEHYGWVSFNGTDLADDPATLSVNETCSPELSQATRTGNAITGGARILSIKTAMAAGNAGGFDGCISLSGAAPAYGVTVSGASLSGYAWSGDLGWIDMSGASVGGTPPPTACAETWVSRASAADNQWTSVAYGNGLFVAVSSSGSGNRVMTSPDGITWTSRVSAADSHWSSVTYGNGLFVAVSTDTFGNRVMTSPDGINWTSGISSTISTTWLSVTYGNGLFVAIAGDGPGNRVMTSPDGVTWTSRASSADEVWSSVTYGEDFHGNKIFVAVGYNGVFDNGAVMTSPDGITWTSRVPSGNYYWFSVTYGNGLFVAVAGNGNGDSVMTSPDGITWTTRASAANSDGWSSVTYGNGLFVAVSYNVVNNRVMTSPDGITWTIHASAADNSWSSVTYGNGLFVAVSYTGTGNRVMTSDCGAVATPSTLKICLNSCGSGSLDFNGGTVSLAPSDVRRYAVCYNTSSDCSDASGDITASGTTSFSASNTPADAVTPTATKGEFTANAVASTQSEDVAITTASGNASMRFTTIYTPTCSSCNDEKTSHCPTEAWTSGCGANCAVGTGTRYCDMNWKEVAPGQ